MPKITVPADANSMFHRSKLNGGDFESALCNARQMAQISLVLSNEDLKSDFEIPKLVQFAVSHTLHFIELADEAFAACVVQS